MGTASLEDLLGSALIACAACFAMLLSRLHASLGADEGYLWYGVQQLLKGRMPHRDFKSYEPGRYLWLGLSARLFGPGLRVLRCATHLFFALGLAAALLALRRLGIEWPVVACAGVALAVLAHPQHKQFEHGAVLSAFAVLQWAWASPAPWPLGCAAATVGLALLLGFNLFLYFAAALLAMISAAAWLGILKPDATALASLAAGAGFGLLPFALMLSVPGFARNFLRRRIGTVLARGESNLRLPLPWPWRAAPAQLQWLDQGHRLALQWTFLALFAVPLAAIAAAIAWPQSGGALLPTAVLGLFLGHHAASRADPPHVTQSLAPLCLLAIQSTASVPGAAIAIAAAALWLVWPLQPLVRQRRAPSAHARRDAGGLEIVVDAAQARLLDAAAVLCADNPGNRSRLFAAPAFPALYAWFRLDAPVYDTFSLYPSPQAMQVRMIDGIEHAAVTVAIVSDAPVDGRQDLRFSRTHALVWRHLHANFHATGRPDLGGDILVFTRPALSGPAATRRCPG